MRFAWCVTKATNTHLEYLIVIAFSRQKWLRERESLLRHTYIAFLFITISNKNERKDQIYKTVNFPVFYMGAKLGLSL